MNAVRLLIIEILFLYNLFFHYFICSPSSWDSTYRGPNYRTLYPEDSPGNHRLVL